MNSILKNIPNTITSMNLLCGVIGVIYVFEGRPDVAFYLMIAAAVFDFFDGLVARAMGAFSDMGKELDSLADVVSFGVLPSLMLYKTSVTCTSCFICYIPLSIAVFSALRLAKFNTDAGQSNSFTGLATPSSAMICGSLAYYVFAEHDSILSHYILQPRVIPIISLLLSMLMVSEIPMFAVKFGKGKTKKSDRIKQLIFAASAVVISVTILILSANPSLIILLSFTAYIVINVLHYLYPKKEKNIKD